MKSLGITNNIAYFDTLIDEVTDTTTSGHVYCAGAKAVMLVFSSAAVSDTQDRTMTLTVEVNNDNSSTYHAYNMLIDNAADTNEQGLTRVASKTIAGTVATHLLWFTPETLGAIARFRVKLARDTAGTAGTFTVKSSVVY